MDCVVYLVTQKKLQKQFSEMFRSAKNRLKNRTCENEILGWVLELALCLSNDSLRLDVISQDGWDAKMLAEEELVENKTKKTKHRVTIQCFFPSSLQVMSQV